MEKQELIGSVCLVGVLIFSVWYLFFKSSRVDGYVREIWIYPIKSTKGIRMTEAMIGSTGFRFDRLFVIVNQNKHFISQRTHPKLALLETSFLRGGCLTITTPDKKSIDIPLEEPTTPYEVHNVTIWNDEVEGIDMGDEVASLINQFLGTGSEMRLMRMPDSYERKTDR